jgi:hypothetical protein
MPIVLPPDLSPPGPCNVFEEHRFSVVATCGSSVLSKVFARNCTFVRNSAGNYTLTLPQNYRMVTGLSWAMRSASGAVYILVLKTDTASTDGELVFEVRTEAGVATDPASGDKLYITVWASRNFLNDAFEKTV